VASCEHGNEPSCCVACWEFLVDIKNYLVAKTDSSTKLFHADEIFEVYLLFPLNSITCSTLYIIQLLFYLTALYYVEVKNSA
jgi:hypothetical protein